MVTTAKVHKDPKILGKISLERIKYVKVRRKGRGTEIELIVAGKSGKRYSIRAQILDIERA